MSALGLDLGGPSKAGEDFQLTPIGEDAEEEDKDSSQVIALDEVAEEEAVGAPLARRFADSDRGLRRRSARRGCRDGRGRQRHVVLHRQRGDAGLLHVPVGRLGMLAYDLIRNMWVWSDVKPYNSFLLEAVNPFLK